MAVLRIAGIFADAWPSDYVSVRDLDDLELPIMICSQRRSGVPGATQSALGLPCRTIIFAIGTSGGASSVRGDCTRDHPGRGIHRISTEEDIITSYYRCKVVTVLDSEQPDVAESTLLLSTGFQRCEAAYLPGWI